MDGLGGALGGESARRIGRVTLFGTGPLLLATAGLLLITLLKTPLRWSGAVLVLIAAIAAAGTPRPDVLIAADGRTVAVRGADGNLSFHRTGSDTFAIREWLAADADGRDVRNPGLGAGIACDPAGCIGRLRDGAMVSYALGPAAFEEDCGRAKLIVALHDPPPACAAMVVGRTDWRTRGALTLRRTDGGFVLNSVRPIYFDRPWSPAAPAPRAPAGKGTAPADATPRPEDVEADQ